MKNFGLVFNHDSMFIAISKTSNFKHFVNRIIRYQEKAIAGDISSNYKNEETTNLAVEEDDFTCSICMCPLIRPRCGDCGHTICEFCAFKQPLITSCPLCRAKWTNPINLKPIVFSLDSLVKKYAGDSYDDAINQRVENRKNVEHNLFRAGEPLVKITGDKEPEIIGKRNKASDDDASDGDASSVSKSEKGLDLNQNVE